LYTMMKMKMMNGYRKVLSVRWLLSPVRWV
jgi:hypothetical protein